MGILRKRKPKIGFWAGDQNNFQFVDPLIVELSKDYSIEKFQFHGDEDQLKKEMDKVEICWFEWGGGPIIPASNLTKHKPIINRIHRFELYLEEPRLINWANVDTTILSSPSMMVKFRNKFPTEYMVARPNLVEIGVDTNLFQFTEKVNTKQILYVGRIHPHKNPSLMLQIFKKIVQEDPEYQLKIIGTFSDELYEEYFYDQIGKLNITDNVIFLGKLTHEEMVQHLQSADFFLITSIIEGLSQASLEAMSCGVVPVIFNYYGSEKAYPKKYIYNTVDEAFEMILSPKGTRIESRSIIDNKYRLEEKVTVINRILEGLVK